MYNHQLDTFLAAAETGSFSGAAKKLYITSSAVLQQINLLESSLHVTLFIRSNKGLKLTPAGEYLQQEAGRLLAWNSNVRQHLLQLEQSPVPVLRVAIPKMHKSRCFYELWTRYIALHPEARMEFVDPGASASPDIFAVYASVDLVEFIQIHSSWQEQKSFLKIADSPMLFEIPKHHPLSHKKCLAPKDLAGQTVVFDTNGICAQTQRGLDLLRNCGVNIRLVSGMNSMTIDSSLMKQEILMLPSCSRHIHPSLQPVECSWDITVPYGFFYSPAACNGAHSFISFAEEQIADGSFTMPED